MRTLRLVVGYDGTEFNGWQYQVGQRTVQGALEEAFGRLGDPGKYCRGSGRTDRGVHARGQVASLRTSISMPINKLLFALRAHLPEDIDLHRIDEMPSEFDALRHTQRKTYRYSLIHGGRMDVFRRRYQLQVPQTLDTELMKKAILPLHGTHDFRAFETRWPNRQSSVRTIHRIDLGVDNWLVWLEIEANGFLYNMVRAIAGTMIDIGRGFRPVSALADALASGSRSQAGPTAPARGLCLQSVAYSDPFKFES